MSKHPITPRERRNATRRDTIEHAVWMLWAAAFMIPPLTPIGVLLLVALVMHVRSERSMRR